LREGEHVCEKFHKIWFHFKLCCAETTATFSRVLPPVFHSFLQDGALRGNRLNLKQCKHLSKLCYPRSNSGKPTDNETGINLRLGVTPVTSPGLHYSRSYSPERKFSILR